jgi:hypothetical protein
VQLISDYRQCFDEILALLAGPDPVFISRIGGSDTDAVVDYCRARTLGEDALTEHRRRYLPLVSNYNGYYDLSQNPRTYYRYLECLIQAYETATSLLVCNYQLLSLYFPETLNSSFYRSDFENRALYQSFVEAHLATNDRTKCYPYQFVEKLVFDDHTLFRVLSQALIGKSVLVVSPFAESISANFARRKSFFKKNYTYPDFDLELVNSPVTYSGLPPDYYPDKDWFGTVEALSNAISSRIFDIALLSCGSYAMPIGRFIEGQMKRKAVYVGGVLQLFFGIIGRRYVNPFFLDQMNVENLLSPIERDRYLKHVTIDEHTAREAFAAYF